MIPEVLAFKKIVLVPHDNITGGSFQYNLDTDTGNIAYVYDIEGSVLFVPISFKGQGSVKVDPQLFKSSNLKIGQSLTVGPFSMTVQSIVNKKAVCALKVQDSNIAENGQAILDVSGEFIDLEMISANGTVRGFSEQIEAKPA